MDSAITGLTAVIAAATIAQAVVAYRLWKLQKFIEDARTRTYVSVAVELRRPEPSRPQEAFVRLENASGVGVLLTRLVLVATQKERTSEPFTLALNFSIAPYGSREKEISNLVATAAANASPNDPAWQDQQHYADVRFTSHYLADRKEQTGPVVVYRIEFAGPNLQKVTLL